MRGLGECCGVEAFCWAVGWWQVSKRAGGAFESYLSVNLVGSGLQCSTDKCS